LNKREELDDKVLIDLFIDASIVSQLQEFSADRIGLFVSRDLESSITGLVKLARGYVGDKIDINRVIESAKKAPPDGDDIGQSHPFPAHRAWALQEFYESDLFHEAVE